MGFVIKWRSLKTEKPKNNQFCHITNDEADHILTNIPWKDDCKAFISLWATPEAGHMYNEENGVTLWCPADEIDVHEGIPND